MRTIGVFDMMGGKTGSALHFGRGGCECSPTLTRGRGSVNDVHALVMREENECA